MSRQAMERQAEIEKLRQENAALRARVEDDKRANMLGMIALARSYDNELTLWLADLKDADNYRLEIWDNPNHKTRHFRAIGREQK